MRSRAKTLVVVLGVTCAAIACVCAIRSGSASAALVAYRNAVVEREIARVTMSFDRSPPRTLQDAEAIVLRPPTRCDDTNEPGPLDDPHDERCPKGTDCHIAWYVASWSIRKHIESPDTRVWFDRGNDDESEGPIKMRVAGCESTDRVISDAKVDLDRVLIHDR